MLLAVLVASAAAAQETVSPPDRDVTAPGMMPGNSADGPMVRIPVPPPPPDPPRWRRYFLPETSDSGTFHVADGLTIRVAGVEPPAADLTCALADGSQWPCGRSALFALRRFLHGRAVECFMAPPQGEREVVASCRVGRTDLTDWLIGGGWAKAGASADDAALSAETEARCAGRGIWRDSRGTGCP